MNQVLLQTKRCYKCTLSKPYTDFNKSHRAKDGLQGLCRKCESVRHACEWNNDLAVNQEHRRQDMRSRRAMWKLMVLEACGMSCHCCGESDARFLTIDHSFNDGDVHRRNVNRDGSSYYKWLIDAGFPRDLGIKTACFNCNCARRITGGVCPHQQMTDALLFSVIDSNEVVTRGGFDLKHSKQKAA